MFTFKITPRINNTYSLQNIFLLYNTTYRARIFPDLDIKYINVFKNLCVKATIKCFQS